ncbi:hypothetical protein GOP47_0014976 [Adiantum capillus-veneris]|uniref:GATA transcription factor n=1 Tax=Adiantum capillus-veneris TaxID=13818 RepID=A0A9D4UMH2_ADICA|nr:hypothetical protein GOP47_0014976 [Adiantum capillus-veneris]
METLQSYEPDALLVDDLLDFSCGDIGGLSEEGDGCVASVCGEENDSNGCFKANPCVVRGSASTQEASASLYLPPEELAGELEWLSRFVEDSYRGADQSMPLVSSDQWFSSCSRKEEEEIGGSCRDQGSTWSTSSWLLMSKSGVFCQILDVGSSPLIETRPGESMTNGGAWDKRGRSKRSSRSGGRVWSLQTVLRKAPAQEEEDCQEEEEEEHSQASSLDYEPFYYDDYGAQQLPPKKKPKKERSNSNEEGRRCSHCQVQKTPQWRAGPLGPKTLCNACGVRYKSGRLLPEYRPAASPTFVNELHSNSHKKVLEMRVSKCRIIPHRHHLDQDDEQQHQDQEELSTSTCSQESIGSLHQQ